MYFEKQERQYCAVHAINNLIGSPVCTVDELNAIANELSPSSWLNPHKSIWGTGNFDVNVLLSTLKRHGYESDYFDNRNDILDVIKLLQNPQTVGLICNIQSLSFWGQSLTRHWFAIRKVRPIDRCTILPCLLLLQDCRSVCMHIA